MISRKPGGPIHVARKRDRSQDPENLEFFDRILNPIVGHGTHDKHTPNIRMTNLAGYSYEYEHSDTTESPAGYAYNFQIK